MPKRDVVAVHHADRRRDVMMPYAPALVVRRGALVFLSGVTAAPVYHSHPHRDEEFDLPTDMRAQATLAMDNLVKTLEAAGCGLADLVSATRYLTDVREQDDLNRVWASYLGDHLPTTTTVEVSRLATHANCKIEIAAIAVTEPAPEPRASVTAGGGKAGASRESAPQSRGTARRGDAAARRGTRSPAGPTRRDRKPAATPGTPSNARRMAGAPRSAGPAGAAASRTARAAPRSGKRPGAAARKAARPARRRPA